MSKESIGRAAASLEQIRTKIEETTLNSVRKTLPDSAIDGACEAVGYSFRRRILTPTVTILHMILGAIWPEDSFASSWQVIWDSMVSRLPGAAGKSPTGATVSKARARLPEGLWQQLFSWLSNKAQELSAPFDRWRSHRVVLMDGTCVSMPDEESLFEEFGTTNTRYGKGRYPLARLVTFALANTMTILGYGLRGYSTDENTVAADLLDLLVEGDLIVGDRHFAGANLYAKYLRQGLEFLTRAHHRLKISNIKRLWSSSANDFVGKMKINSTHRKGDPSLPRWIRVRFIQASLVVRGKQKTAWLVTSLLDAKNYPAAEIAEIYSRRWRIETLFKAVKIEMSADVLRSKRPDGIRKEVCARLMALNIIRIIMLEAAQEHGVDPLRVSFVHATRCILAFAPALASEPAWVLNAIYRAMLKQIASHLVPDRPRRNEPRSLRREDKHYPTLRTTRAQWRLENVA
ncbi:IS4 family transposase [Planctomycetota bacterium]